MVHHTTLRFFSSVAHELQRREADAIWRQRCEHVLLCVVLSEQIEQRCPVHLPVHHSVCPELAAPEQRVHSTHVPLCYIVLAISTD